MEEVDPLEVAVPEVVGNELFSKYLKQNKKGHKPLFAYNSNRKIYSSPFSE